MPPAILAWSVPKKSWDAVGQSSLTWKQRSVSNSYVSAGQNLTAGYKAACTRQQSDLAAKQTTSASSSNESIKILQRCGADGCENFKLA